MVEIDILAECTHKNVINLYEAYYFDNKLWVSLTQVAYKTFKYSRYR